MIFWESSRNKLSCFLTTEDAEVKLEVTEFFFNNHKELEDSRRNKGGLIGRDCSLITIEYHREFTELHLGTDWLGFKNGSLNFSIF